MFKRLKQRLQRTYLEECGFASGKRFTDEIISDLAPQALFLDAGCGQGELRSLLPSGARYVGIDHSLGGAKEYPGWTHRPTVVADLHALPLKESCVDRVAMLHVLEHLRAPDAALAELAAICKPGADVYLAVPFVHQVHHAPHDFYRYTEFGLTHLLSAAGFSVAYTRPTGGYHRCLHKVLGQRPKPKKPRRTLLTLVRAPVVALIALLRLVVGALEYLLDLEDAEQGLVCGYVGRARRVAD